MPVMSALGIGGENGNPSTMPPPLPELAGVQHRFVALPTGVRVHLAEAGPDDAPRILCLHGWPQHWWIWRRVIGLLGDDFHLLCPDLRGFGWSGWPADGDFAKRRLADDALALLDVLGLERVHVIGHDWGAWTAILLAIDAPERLHGALALGIIHPWQPTSRMLINAWRLSYQQPLATPLLGELLMRQSGFVRRVLRAGWATDEAWDEEAADLYAAAMRDADAARAGSRMYRTFLLRELGPAAVSFRGRRLGVPARLLIGAHDPLGAQLSAGFERHGDDAAAEVLEGCGHFVPEERPEIVAERARALFV
jgi:pimeloyl-ACP methyl ester carboxylesterase